MPFPERLGAENEALQARMRELRGNASSSNPPRTRSSVSAVRASITLNAKQHAVVEEARIELRTRIGGVEGYTLARAVDDPALAREILAAARTELAKA